MLTFLLVSVALSLFAYSWAFEAPTVLPERPAGPKPRHAFAQGPEIEMTEYTIKKGRHFSMPRIFKLRNRPEKVSWLVEFSEHCAYDLGDEDQKDWNKLVGLFYNFFNTLDNTVMVGWRWNPETRLMELNAYYHVDGSREFTRPLLDVELGKLVRVDILVNYEKREYTVALERYSDGKQAVHTKAFSHARGRCLEINTYFGGNETAPRNLTIRKAYIP